MTDVVPQDDRYEPDDPDICAREAIAVIEAVLDRRCPEMRIAFWTAVDRHYRLDTQAAHRTDRAARSGLDARPSVEER
ncbi:MULTISPECIES: hypothetical protein [unclassified Methylobacterium]|uniref:hypothetical protein n=1 Tax=unclassified Methylobacterium TaxID=2615210 RepID=UPI0011C1F8DA|nr:MULTISPECIES: hypothetical protein [unclassified Methylobacterium]QEE41168.1 hypothetical protein FVA80_21520 [Methylobacterium sp. WL1]TXN56480.1 hypothetical protein FV241_15375 [Methylobacterium sp. WL2]